MLDYPILLDNAIFSLEEPVNAYNLELFPETTIKDKITADIDFFSENIYKKYTQIKKILEKYADNKITNHKIKNYARYIIPLLQKKIKKKLKKNHNNLNDEFCSSYSDRPSCLLIVFIKN